MKMKTKILSLIAIVSFIGLFTACDSMEDINNTFVGDGEFVYIGKADSIKTKPGRNRLELSWLLLSDPRVASYKVLWNNKADSIQGMLTKTEGVDTVRIMFDNMNEAVHQFDIFLYDKLGNASIRSSINGRVYGLKYEASLLNRTFEREIRDGDNLIMEWVEAGEDVAAVEVEYLDNSNKMVRKQIPGKTIIDTLQNFPLGGSLMYRTKYLPEPLAIDAFYSDYQNISFDI